MNISIESKKQEKKDCIIVNDFFSWRLIVDGKDINFMGIDSANYFEKHYQELGYKVKVMKFRQNNRRE